MSSQTMAAPMIGRQDRDPTERDFSTDLLHVAAADAANLPFFATSDEHSWAPEVDTLPLAVEHQDNKREAITNLLAQLSRNHTGQPQETTTASHMLDLQASGTEATTPTPAAPTEHLAQGTTHDQSTAQFTNIYTNKDIAYSYAGMSGSPAAEMLTDIHLPDLPELPTEAEVLQNLDEEPPDHIHESAQQGRVEAFAKLDMPDGSYFITTHSIELGRDVRALHAALAREAESKSSHQREGGSSSGKKSHPSSRLRREPGSLAKGSVVSEKGGFCGMDDTAAVAQEEKEAARHSQSSQSSIVRPEDLLRPGPAAEFDYQLAAEVAAEAAEMEKDDEEPAPVTSEHLPKANSNPLIPIHHMTDTAKSEVDNHKSISRRHVRIAWDFKQFCFKLHVLGRNGAFLDNNYMPYNSSGVLRHGSQIQISGIEITFCLPSSGNDHSTDASDEDEEASPGVNKRSTTPTSEDVAGSASPPGGGKSSNKIRIKLIKKATPPKPAVALNADGQPMPPKKRGPGRPPKDGIMSNRERREIARAQKLAEQKAANGGVTPPPTGKGKPLRTSLNPEATEDAKPEKRKYTKRKRADDDDVLPSIEGETGGKSPGSDGAPKKPRKTRASRSASPNYPPKDTLSEEQLARPADAYARLIYDILMEIHPKSMSLRHIYRALKTRYPFFVYGTDTEGWQSSVRHNLNADVLKKFGKGGKDGKGFNWYAIPGAMEPKEEEEKKRKAQAAAAEAKTKANNAPSGARYPPGPSRAGPWPQQGPPYPYPGMPPNGVGPPQAYYGPIPNGMQWAPPPTYFNGPPPPPGQMYHPPPRVNGPPPPGHSNQQGMPYPGQPFPINAAPPPHQYSGPPPPPNQVPPNGPPPSTSKSPHPPANLQPNQNTASNDPSMPCTQVGMLRIEEYEKSMIENMGIEKDRIRKIISAVRDRVFHGAIDSGIPESDKQGQNVFDMVLGHVENFVKTHPNPDFAGLAKRTLDGPAEAGPQTESAQTTNTDSVVPEAEMKTAEADKEASVEQQGETVAPAPGDL